MVLRAAYCQLSVEMLGSEVDERTPSPRMPLICESWAPIAEFTVPGPPALEPICNTLTLWMLPFAALYWKTPLCAPGLSTEALAVMLCGWIDCAYVPKKNSLFFRIGPPMLPPKSFSLTMLRGSERALLLHALAFRAVFWKSSNTRP